MRYFPIQLIALKADTAKEPDVLGNPALVEAAIGKFRGRWTEWTAEEIKLDGRNITKGARKLLTDAPLSACRKAAFLYAGEEQYRITDVLDLNGRWRALIVERYRQKKVAA